MREPRSPRALEPDTVIRFGEVGRRLANPIARNLQDHLEPGEIVRLLPPKHLGDGLKDGSLEMLRTKAGDSAIIVQSESRDFAGHAIVKRDVRSHAKGKPLLSPAVAWQVAAVATQQHYLQEIDAKLEGISSSVRDLQGRMQNAELGTLLSIRAGLDDIRERRAHGVAPGAEERTLLRSWTQKAEALRYTAIFNVKQAFERAAKEDRRKEYLKTTLAELGDSAVRDFEIARLATEVQMAARNELLELSTDDRELEHLLEDNAKTADRVVSELTTAASLFTEALGRARELDDLVLLGEKVVDGLEKATDYYVPAHPLARAGKALQRRDEAKRKQWLENFEAAAECPVRIAERDMAPTTPQELLLYRAANGDVEIRVGLSGPSAPARVASPA